MSSKYSKEVKCGKCSLVSKNHTIKEEKELVLIEKNLHYDHEAKRWIVEYPWIRDPKDLPENKKAAFVKLISTEKRLAKKSEHAKVCKQQILDMVNRGVARKLDASFSPHFRISVCFFFLVLLFFKTRSKVNNVFSKTRKKQEEVPLILGKDLGY